MTDVVDPPQTRPDAPPPPPEETEPSSAGPSWVPDVVTTLAALVVAFVVGALLIAFSDETAVRALGSDPGAFLGDAADAIGSSYAALVRGSLGSPDAIGSTLVRAAPLICAALGVTLAFRAGLFNIGAQGQLAVGALAAGFVSFHWQFTDWLQVPAAVLAGIAGGALYGWIAGILKARTGAHEVITTIMLNNIAAKTIVIYVLGLNVFQRPDSDELRTPLPEARFPQIGSAHLGVVVALAAAVAVWWFIERSTWGFELKAVGANGSAARTAGMNVGRVYVIAMLLAGALAGLAATMNLLGHGDPVTDSTAGTIGFDAITVALLGRATPLGTVLAGLLFGALSVGGGYMQANAGTSVQLAAVLQATIVLFVAAPALVRGMIRLRARGSESTVMAKGWGS